MQRNAYKPLARKLVAASLEDGRISDSRVKAVLQMLRGQPERQRKQILEEYLRQMRREQERSHLLIEHAGPLASSAREAIVRSVSARAGRPLEVEVRENPALIGGTRVRLGDDIYDASIESRLRQLSNAQ